MTKRSLALSAGVTTQTLTKWLGSATTPEATVIAQIASDMGFPESFFYADDLDEPPRDAVSFHAMSGLTARMRDSVLAAGTFGLALSDWIEERFLLPDVNIFAREYDSPRAAAAEIRCNWGLGEQPIRNIVRLLESRGVRVFSMSEPLKVDAYSFWRDGKPYIFLNTSKSAERSRMDAAHELGHLVLRSQDEDYAKQFASAFLMSEGSILAYVNRGATLQEIIKAKHYWIVSAAALTYRMHEVGMLNDREYRTRFQQIGRLRYRTNEPEPADMERSEVLSLVFQTLSEDGISVRQVAEKLFLPPDELNRLLFGFIGSPVPIPTPN